MTVRLGEVAEAAFIAENRGTVRTSGLAAFNVMPGEDGVYFNKIACFCFNEQTLAPGETARWPVDVLRRSVDPRRPDREVRRHDYAFLHVLPRRRRPGQAGCRGRAPEPEAEAPL